MDIKTKKQIQSGAAKLIHGFSVPAITDAAGWETVRTQAAILVEHADALVEANGPAEAEAATDTDSGEES